MSVDVHQIIKMPIGVSRETARLLYQPIEIAAHTNAGILDVDFLGMAGLTPSFLDEVLRILEETSKDRQWKARLTNVPTEFPSKYQAVARSHALTARIDGSIWTLEKAGVA